MKAQAEHRVPLSDRAVALLNSLYRERDNPFVFIGTQPGSGLSNMAMAAVLHRMERTDITVHGFRSTFRDWAAETHGASPTTSSRWRWRMRLVTKLRRRTGEAIYSTSAAN